MSVGGCHNHLVFKVFQWDHCMDWGAVVKVFYGGEQLGNCGV